jgi:hypothetical protein
LCQHSRTIILIARTQLDELQTLLCRKRCGGSTLFSALVP